MRLSALIINYALLTGIVFARPRTTLADRLARRPTGGPPINATFGEIGASSPGRLPSPESAQSAQTFITSSNWAGAVLPPVAGQRYQTSSATFIVPTPRVPAGQPTAGVYYGAFVWAGIDGGIDSTSCNGVVLQTGIIMVIDNGVLSYQAWYEWWPDYSHTFVNFPISPGDTITAMVVATSTTTGIAYLENVTQGKTFTEYLTSTSPLCGQNAEWIVEDYTEGPQVPFIDFVEVKFTGVSASNSVATYDASSAEIWSIYQNNTYQTNIVTSGSTVDVKHT